MIMPSCGELRNPGAKIFGQTDKAMETVEIKARVAALAAAAAVSAIATQDFPEAHCDVTFQRYSCGFVTGDGSEESPCPFGPNWPQLDEFDFITKEDGIGWTCQAVPKTPRARKIHLVRQGGSTKDEAENRAKATARPRKDDEDLPPGWYAP